VQGIIKGMPQKLGSAGVGTASPSEKAENAVVIIIIIILED